jgi:hypothetical protein
MSKGSRNRSCNKAYADGYERVFGKKDPKDFQKGGRSRQVYHIGEDGSMVGGSRVRKRDNKNMRSMQMGCTDPEEQQRNLEIFGKNGLDHVYYDPDTAELCGINGLEEQKKLARLHQLEVG